MEITLSRIYLQTTNKATLISFLTSVFDTEVSIDILGQEFVNVNGIHLYFLECDSKTLRIPFSTFTFSVDDAELLGDLKNKIEFYYYRELMHCPEIVLGPQSLEFRDPDDNFWKIEFLDCFTQVESAGQNLQVSSSVRI